MDKQPSTVGEALANMTLWAAGVYACFAAMIIGSIGPWVTAPLSSSSGLSGDGQITGLLAVIGVVMLARRRILSTALSCLLILGFGIYEAAHLSAKLSSVRISGVQVDHVGWGVYLIIVAAAVALVVLWRAGGLAGAIRTATRKVGPHEI